jgi:RES domain-containing protein
LNERYAAAPRPSYRLIPSRFPPIGLFDTVARAGDLEAVMELAGWTNDRLVAERLRRLPEREWVYGRPNASVVMAAFLHAAPGGSRFNGPELGAWYAAASVTTAIIEVAHHLRREAVARQMPEMERTFRSYQSYSARLDGRYRDIRGQQQALPELYASASYAASQRFGEALRAIGSDGIIYDSVRHRGGVNVCAYRANKVLEVTQAAHYDIGVQVADRQIQVRELKAD